MEHHGKSFFQQVKELYVKKNAEAIAANQNPPGIPILSQSSLRLEQYVTTTTTQYTFPVLQGDVGQGSQSVLANEVRLQTNDNFHIHKVGFYLAVTSASTDTAFRFLTYPSDLDFVTVAAALSYMNVYNGTLKINVNQVDVLTNYRVMKHYMVPQTQRLTATVDNNYDQMNLESDSLITMEPSIMLSGAYTNTITINLNGAVASALASNNSRMIIIFDGIRAQNAAIRK